MTNPPAPQADPEMLVVQAAVLHELGLQVDARKSAAKSALSAVMGRGSKITGHDPRTGRALGAVEKSDPDPEVCISDPAAFESWVRTKYADRLTAELVFGPREEIAAVLLEHAPHLVREEIVIPDDVRAEALKFALDHHVPGTVHQEVRPTVSVNIKATKKTVAGVVGELLGSEPFTLLALEASA